MMELKSSHGINNKYNKTIKTKPTYLFLSDTGLMNIKYLNLVANYLQLL